MLSDGRQRGAARGQLDQFGDGGDDGADVGDVAARCSAAVDLHRAAVEGGADPAVERHVGSLARADDRERPEHAHGRAAGRGAAAQASSAAAFERA